MAEDAFEIVARWRGNVSPEVPIEEVEKVVEAYFPKTFRYTGKTGSHWLIIDDAELKLAEENGYITGTTQGKLAFSHVKGKRVKRWLIQNLLEAIAIKEEFRRIREEGS